MADEISIVVRAEDKFSDVLGNFGNIMTGLKSIVDLADQAFETFIVPIVDFGKESILTAARVEELAAVNKILAENAGIPAEVIPSLVDAIRAQGIEASIAETTVAQLIRANIDLSKATDLARVAQDAAVIAGTNSSEALDNIIYGITTLNPLVLRHAGIIVDLQLAYKEYAEANNKSTLELTTAEKQQIAFNEVMEAGVQIAGAYTTAMEEPGKVLRSFPRIFDDIKVALGEPFQDAFGSVILAGYDLAKAFSTTIREGGQFAPFLDEIGQEVADFVAPFSEFVGDFADGIKDGLNPIIALANAFQNLNDNNPSPIFESIVDALLQMNQGIPFIDAFKGLLADLSSNDNWLGSFSGGLLTFISDVENQGLGVGIGNLIDNIIRGIDFPGKIGVIVDFITTAIEGKGDQIGAILGPILQGAFEIALTGIAIATDILQPVADEIIHALVIAFRNVNVGEETWRAIVGDVWVEQSGKDIASVLGRSILDGISGIGKDIWDGIKNGWNNFADNQRTTIQGWGESITRWFKDVFGIASPSTVFAEIGRNIIEGLMMGIQSSLTFLLSFLDTVANIILSPFQPVLDLLGIDISGTGSIGTGLSGGAANGLGALGTTTTASSANTVNNYFYGTVVFGDMGQLGYDCQYPNPLINSTSQSLNTSGF